MKVNVKKWMQTSGCENIIAQFIKTQAIDRMKIIQASPQKKYIT